MERFENNARGRERERERMEREREREWREFSLGETLGSSRNALRKSSMMREHALAVLSEVLPWDSKRLALLPAYSLFSEFLAAFTPPVLTVCP